MNKIGEILVAVGLSSAVLFGALAYLIRSLVGQWLNKDMERFKLELSKDVEAFKQSLKYTADTELEKLRHELRIRAAELERSRAILAERRAKILARLYRLICGYSSRLDGIASFAEFKFLGSHDSKGVMDAAKELYAYYEVRKIYLPNELCIKIEDLHALFIPAHVDSLFAKDDDARFAIWKRACEDAHQIQEDILTSFRQLIGVAVAH